MESSAAEHQDTSSSTEGSSKRPVTTGTAPVLPLWAELHSKAQQSSSHRLAASPLPPLHPTLEHLQKSAAIHASLAGPHQQQALSSVIPAQLQRVAQRVLHRLFHTRSCLFVVLHVVLQAAVYAEYTWEVFVYCWELQFHLLILLLPYLLLAGNVGCFILCSRANPGIITKSNHASLVKIYAYDGVLFQKGIVCPTCDLEKPARSKHCSFCSMCVHRFDHHCVWVNNCIGASNTKYFFLYLFTLTAMAATTAVISAAFLNQVVLLSGMMHGSYIDDQGQERAVDILFLIQHLFLTFPRIVFMLGFVILLTLVLGAYSCFNLYLALTNQTCNEWYKSRRHGCCHHPTLQPHDRQAVYKNIYSKGVWRNLVEIFKPPAVLESKKKT
ncbi:palmitoyltransferase ZDHHC4 isoform X1 [Pezoporus wallicus]|uniref:palmitoyltransferase ZDHHC4 isoform X1 n=1 Tax=Pezoporus wallicus TaxID=35540 RepID=UPI00254DB675|nr:palmitoyltransferase ZDHHC4 isoform X1 [Pezoporus wallicus]